MSYSNEHVDIKKRRRRKIRALLVEEGITLASIARRMGLTKSTVCDVVTGGRQSRRVKLAVAQALRMKPKELWPEDFQNNRHAA